MFKQYKIIAILSLLALIFSVISYYYFKSEKLTVDVKNKEVEIEVEKEKAEIEILETKWETIAVEHNKTLKEKKDEIKEPINHDDVNVTDFFFFRMFS